MNSGSFDSSKLEALGWRQGSVLTGAVETAARESAPSHIELSEADWLILTSHDCDVANHSLEKEPIVEVLRAVPTLSKKLDKGQAWGRNPRNLHISGLNENGNVVLSCSVHERWTLSRQELLFCGPCKKRQLQEKQSRVVAEWLAKRYVRPAFPTAFDARWHQKLRAWTKLLGRFNEWIQGVYLRLNTSEELKDSQVPYRFDLIVAVDVEKKTRDEWPQTRDEIETEIIDFWEQFEPGVICDGVDVLGTDEISLADIDKYQRFDADWLSFADDDLPRTPVVADMRT